LVVGFSVNGHFISFFKYKPVVLGLN